MLEAEGSSKAMLEARGLKLGLKPLVEGSSKAMKALLRLC